MALDVSAFNSNTEGGDQRCYNPFERMQPPLRSEEDEVRKGIFGQALRLLYAATDEEKLRWRHAIVQATATKQSAPREGNNKKKRKSTVDEGEKSTTVFPASVAGKRLRDSDDVESNEIINTTREEIEETTINKRSGEAESSNACVEGPENCGSCASVADRQLSDLEFIAAYLRTLLDKVVGLSLLELNVDALRVLCVMLGIPLPNSRGKMAHYSTLASFHFTHCEKLGKRVSNSYHLQSQLKRDEEMVRKILLKGPKPHAATSSSSNKTTRAGDAEKLCSTASANNQSKKQRKDGTVLVAIDSNVSSPSVASHLGCPNPPAVQSTLNKSQKAFLVDASRVTQAESHELGIWHNGKVFGRPIARQAKQPSRNDDDDSDEEEEWPLAELEKKVASVVQMYDPVTSAVVVKKLAQMGYRKTHAKETVEAILRSFHQRGLVFYDNGIAYLL